MSVSDNLMLSLTYSFRPLIIENRNITMNKDISNLENTLSFVTNFSEFLNNDLKEYVKESIKLSETDINKINQTFENTRNTFKGRDKQNNPIYIKEKVKSDLEIEKDKIQTIGGSTEQTLELQTSKTVLDAMCGQTGETCLSTNYDVSFIEKKEFQPITIVNKQTKLADGSIYAFVTDVNGEKAIVSLGIEPKIRLVNKATSKTELAEKLITALKEVAKLNNIQNIYLSGEDGEVSNRDDVVKILKEKYITGKKHITKNIDFPNKAKERKLYKIE
jgi:hypothetical protein